MSAKAPLSPGQIAALPYRPCVGVALFNRAGRVWVGRRNDDPKDAEGLGQWWQMPQGGIDPGEEPLPAARRELYEETSVRSAAPIAEVPGWVTYDLPPHLLGRAWGGRFRGQRQKWFAFRFEGADDEIDILHPAGGHKAEFLDWRWENLERLPELIVPFKRAVYEDVVRAFSAIPAG